jgi:hypothetical protein
MPDDAPVTRIFEPSSNMSNPLAYVRRVSVAPGR